MDIYNMNFNPNSFNGASSLPPNNYPVNFQAPNQSYALVPYCPNPPDFTYQINDEAMVEYWLSSIGKLHVTSGFLVSNPPPQNAEKQGRLQINVAKSYLQTTLEILDKLQKVKEEIEESVQALSSAQWKLKTVEIGNLKETFGKIMANFNKDNLVALKYAIDRREKKRKTDKVRRAQRKIERKEMIEERRKIDKAIDQWMLNKKEEAEKAKENEMMAKDIDCVLAEVMRKKSEAKKQLSLISSLIKVREVRENMAVQRGEKVSIENKRAFSVTTEKLIKLWEDALKNYTDEEHMLKTISEKNATDNMKYKQMMKEKAIIDEWDQILFGPKAAIEPENATYWALTAADRDVETFVAIRRSWDTFLVPKASDLGASIPTGWVRPPDNPSDGWIDYLHKK